MFPIKIVILVKMNEYINRIHVKTLSLYKMIEDE